MQTTGIAGTHPLKLQSAAIDDFGAGARGEASLAATVATALIILAGYAFESPEVLWCSLAPALWLAISHPIRLIQLLAVTAPVFPVVRLTRDIVGAQEVSTKGLFLSGDDPIIIALGVAWIIAVMRTGGRRAAWYPSALTGLLALYPLVTLANLWRLETNQTVVSLLYYGKWAEYAILLIFVPKIVRGSEGIRLAESVPRIMMAACV